MTNEKLAILGATGDIESVHKLYFSVAPLLYKLISRYFPLCNSRLSAPDDLLQCGYFALLAAIRAYTPEKELRFTSYLAFHVANACLAELGLRGKKRLQTISLETPVPGRNGITLADTIEDPDANAYEYSELCELSLIVRREIAKLPEKEQYAIFATVYEGKNYEQIMRETGWDKKKLKKHKYRAYAWLRESPEIQKLRQAWSITDMTEYTNPEQLVVSFADSGLDFLWEDGYAG